MILESASVCLADLAAVNRKGLVVQAALLSQICKADRYSLNHKALHVHCCCLMMTANAYAKVFLFWSATQPCHSYLWHTRIA